MNLSDRVQRLRARVCPQSAPIRFCFREDGETSEQAVARYIAEQPDDADADIRVICWVTPGVTDRG